LYATVKNKWPSLNVEILRTVMRLVLDDPEIIDQIHELILEDCQISAKSIAEHLGITREWAWVHLSRKFGQAEAVREVWPKISERGSKRQRCQSPEHILEFFGAIHIICCHD